MKFLAIIEEKFLSLLDVLVGVNSDSVITIHHENFHFAIWLGTMVSKPNFAPDPKN